MRRPMFLPITIVLFLATAGVLASAAWLLPSTGTVAISSAGEEIARRFYDAVNVAIATGDIGPLRAVVAADFVDTDPLPGLGPGRDGLEAALLGLHATAPGVQLEVEALVAAGDHVMTRIAIRGEPSDSFLRMPLGTTPHPWGAVDVLWVSEGVIVERRGLTEGTGMLRAVQTMPLPPIDQSLHVVAVERITLAPGIERRIDASLGPIVVLAEMGTVRVAFDPGSPGAGTPAVFGGAPKTPRKLPPGEIVVVPAGFGATATTTGRAAAALWLFAIVPLRSSGAAELSGIGGAPEGAATGLLPEGPLAIAAGRVVLAAGAALAVAGAEGPVLLGVDDGRLSSALDRPAVVRWGGDRSPDVVTSADLGPADGLLMDPGTSLVLRNDGPEPAAAWLLVITRVGA